MLLAFLIFLATLALVITQPKGLGIGTSAWLGAGVALLAGVVSWHDIPTVWHIVWDATFTLIALILISLILDAAGFFEWTALHIARRAVGRGNLLFVFIVLLGAVIAALFANDGAVLILTPLVIEILRILRFTPAAMLAFVMAAGFIADSASLPFKISNLVNIIAANYAEIGFNDYAAVMGWVNLVSVAASLLILLWYFQKDIPAQYDASGLPQPDSAIRDPLVFRAGWAVLAGLLAGYLLSQRLQIPTSFITGAGALILVVLAGREHFAGKQERAVIPVWTLFREAPWQVVIFSLGMYLVVYGLRNQGLTAELAAILEWLSGQGLTVATIGTGFIMAGLSAIMNNLPAVLAGSLAIAQAEITPAMREAMVYANIIGCDLGPKITPIGSLATLLWLHILMQRGMTIGWGQYFRIGIVLTIPVLLTVLLALAFVLA
ncbi:arsenical efflux pump membrane protein ArsB [Sulfuriferula sp. AH1]|uniref:arsenic transporter n=1 Tax=Sulfuriferula sp. AH1 TaxID=1985873 RepID=UPI000B3B8390|nr:arsenic transporter [Sulfuriferula sp. AH1]ARU31536.1 arsenical efflux pump membrane protein ArsB [Sulfuriferula sp. AH1]